MNIKDITALTIKISGIVLFVLVVAKMPEHFKGYLAAQEEVRSISIWHYIVPLLIPGIFAILLVAFPYKISSKLVFKENIQPDTDANLKRIEIIAIRILGLLLLYFAISDIVFHTSNYIMLRSINQQDFPVAAYNYPYIITTAVELLFALWLLAGTNNVISLLVKIRRQ